MKIIAYHGSQDDNLTLESRSLYLTDSKRIATDFALGYAFDYDLFPEDKPTVYTIEANIDESRVKYLSTEEEYEAYMDMVNDFKSEDYDALICHINGDDYTYYQILDAKKHCKIIDKVKLKTDKKGRPLTERLEELKEGIYATLPKPNSTEILDLPESFNLVEDVVSLKDFKDNKIMSNLKDFADSLIQMGNVANPSNPFSWVAEKLEDMSHWNQKDWEILFKRPLNFEELRGAQTTFEEMSKRVKEIADLYDKNKNKNKNESKSKSKKYKSNIKQITERLEELTTGVYATNSAFDVVNIMKNKPKAYRIIYDSNINYYFIGDAFNYIHIDLLEEAYKWAFYPNMFAVDEMRDYMDEELYNDTLLLFSFYPNNLGTKLDIEKSSDGYTRKYVYDFGNIYAHEMTPLEHSDIYSILGKPLKREDIFEDKINFKRLNRQLDQIIEMSPNYPRKQTGLPVLIYVSAKEGSHGPRIKFLNRLNSSWRGSKDPDSVSISICDDPKIVYPKTGVRLRISNKEFNQIRAWIIQNKDVLLDFWNGVIPTKEELDSKLTKLNLDIS